MKNYRVHHHGERIGDGVKDLESPDFETKWGKGSEEERGADLNESLPCGYEPGMIAIGEVPGSQPVEQGHAKGGEEEPKEPEERARIAKAEIEMPKGRQQKCGQDESRYLV